MSTSFLSYQDVSDISKYIKYRISDIKEWYRGYFTSNGVQGLAGILHINVRDEDKLSSTSSENSKCSKSSNSPKKIKTVFKISKYLDFVIQNEGIVMEKTNEMRKYIPHFCCSFGYFNVPISSYYYAEKTNPFAKEEIYVDVLITEYIQDSITFCKILSECTYEEIISILKQSLLALYISQEKMKFTHYDLHTDNILIRKCEKNALYVYILTPEHIYLIETFGNCPVIIDFGFSYADHCIDKPLCNTLNHTNVGYLSTLADSVVDSRLLLVNIGSEILDEKDRPEIKDLSEKIFKNCKYMNWSTGWDDREDDESGLDEVLNILDEESSISSDEKKTPSKTPSIFTNHLESFLGIVQYLITLPLKKKHSTHKNIKKYYENVKAILQPIEKEIGDELIMLYIIQQIVMSISKYKKEFLRNPEKTGNKIKDDIFHKIIKIVPFYEIDIDISLLANNLLYMADYMESIYFDNLKDIVSQKKKEYRKGKDVMEIFNMVNDISPSRTKDIDEDTPIYFFDIQKEKMRKTYPSKLICKYFNKLVEKDRGKYLYKYLY